MKNKILFAAALIGTASLSVQAGVHIGLSLGFPVPVAPVVVAPPVVVVPPAPVVEIPAAPVVEAPVVPAVVVDDWFWAPGYWCDGPHGRLWIAGHREYRRGHDFYGRREGAGERHAAPAGRHSAPVGHTGGHR